MRDDIEFAAADGTVLRGWYYRPEQTSGTWPVVVMSHGFGAVKQMYLDVFAEGLLSAGLGCLVYDHRSFGDSDGHPRQEIDPFLQIADTRDAITYASQLDGADPERIGLWGSSYSGGHALVLAATDRRIRAVVAQVPTISGARNTLRRFPGDGLAEIRTRFAVDRIGRLRGEPTTMVPIVPGLAPDDLTSAGEQDPTRRRVGNDMGAWIAHTPAERLDRWHNEMTLRSQELYASYEPGVHITAVSPTPLLVISMTEDTMTPTDEILAAYQQGHEPKRLILLRGGHFDVYGVHRDTAITAARDWFTQHLTAPG
ncbi:MAG: alpha/beta fold hydrolase [Geodermatophilaceae bacterium]|nr:alpha/beta fold hydrolase [Geodermatophilaceae bacterium]